MASSPLLKKFYFSRIGQWIAKILSPAIHSLRQPRMLWGYRDGSRQWRVRTRISDTAYFYHAEKIFLDEDVFIGHYTILDGTGGLSIGRGTQLAGWNGVYTHSSHIAIRLYGYHYHEIPEQDKFAFAIAPVNIGRYVFVGAGAIILPGVTIGDGALIAAGAVVNRSVDPFMLMSGNPAKVIGDTRRIDERYLREYPDLRAWYDEWVIDLGARDITPTASATDSH